MMTRLFDKRMWFLGALFLVSTLVVNAENFQPVVVTADNAFFNLSIQVCSTDAVCGDVLVQNFTSGTNRSSTVVYLSTVSSNYSTPYYFNAYADGVLIFNKTKSYLGRGPIQVGDIPTAAPAAGDVSHVCTSAAVYNFVTGQGYMTSEADPIFGNSTAKGITSTDTGHWNTAYGWGDHSTQGYIKSYTESDSIWVAAKTGVDNNISNLWTNASNQNTQIQSLLTADTNLWTNASDQQGKFTWLYTNASNQDGRIITLEGRAIPALQPNIDGANITTGVIPLARMPSGWLNKTYGDTLYEPIDTMFTKAEDIARFVNRSDWTTHDSYPAACGAGTAVTTIGDTNTCTAFLTTEVDGSTTNEIQNVITGGGLQRDGSNNFGLLTCAEGKILKMGVSAYECSDDSGITTVPAAYYTNITALQANATALWSNASNTVGRVITLEGRPIPALQPNIDLANITTANGALSVHLTMAASKNITLTTTAALNFGNGCCARAYNTTHSAFECPCGV